MARGVQFGFRNRRPRLILPQGFSAVVRRVPAALVVTRRPGPPAGVAVVVAGRLTQQLGPAPVPRPLLVVAPSPPAPRGWVTLARLRRAVATVPARLPPVAVLTVGSQARRPEVAVVSRLRRPAAAAPAPQRTYRLPAAVAVTWTLASEAATGPRLAAAPQTVRFLAASFPMSVQSDVAFFQGEDLTLNFQMTPAQDVTGWTLVSTVRDKLGGTVQFTPPVTITDAGRGRFKVVWPRASTSALAAGNYVWDVRRIDSGNNAVLAHGEATCRQAVTA
jgi:hypothetical protein